MHVQALSELDSSHPQMTRATVARVLAFRRDTERLISFQVRPHCSRLMTRVHSMHALSGATKYNSQKTECTFDKNVEAWTAREMFVEAERERQAELR